MNKYEAYEECKAKMEKAANYIRSKALCFMSDYFSGIDNTRSIHGSYEREHLYWLHCMHFVEAQDDSVLFKIDDDYLYLMTDNNYTRLTYQMVGDY